VPATDMAIAGRILTYLSVAQRGPGLASRQRRPELRVRPHLPLRSTRAGTRVPATAAGPSSTRGACFHRSTRAGTRVPATVGSGNRRADPTVERSTRAGTRVPATAGRLFTTNSAAHAQRGPGLASRQRASWGSIL